MKLIALIVILPLIIFGSIWGLESFLSPDDLKDCDESPSVSLANCMKADAIIAISGGDTAARVDEAVRLYRAGWADKIIFSGAASDTESPSNARSMRKLALSAGIPENAIEIEESARDTSENAQNTLRLTASGGAERVILVTSPYHQRRASMEFELVSGSQVEVVNHPASKDKHWSDTWWLTSRGWWLAIGELVKILVVATQGTML